LLFQIRLENQSAFLENAATSRPASV